MLMYEFGEKKKSISRLCQDREREKILFLKKWTKENQIQGHS